MTQKISKKFIIVLSAFVAVVLLTMRLIVSGTAENIYFHFAARNIHVEPKGGVHLLDDLRSGKYLLQCVKISPQITVKIDKNLLLYYDI